MRIHKKQYPSKNNKKAAEKITLEQTGEFLVLCHMLVLKSVSYPKIVKNTPILIEQSIACDAYT